MNKRDKITGMIIVTAGSIAATHFTQHIAFTILEMVAIVFTVGYIVKDLVVKRR